MAALVSLGFPSPRAGSLQRELNGKEAVLLLPSPSALCFVCSGLSPRQLADLSSLPSRPWQRTHAQAHAHACAHPHECTPKRACSSTSTRVCPAGSLASLTTSFLTEQPLFKPFLRLLTVAPWAHGAGAGIAALPTAAGAWAQAVCAVRARLDSAVPRGPSSRGRSEGLDGTQWLPANGPGCSCCLLPPVNQGTFPSLPSPLHCPRVQVTLRLCQSWPSVPQCCVHHPIPTHMGWGISSASPPDAGLGYF